MAAIARGQNRHRTTLRRAVPSFLLALVATTLLASPARAAGASFSVEPLDAPTAKPYFVFEGRAGSELTGRVRIVNSGTSAGSAKLYAVDATTGQTSGAVYKEAREPRRGVGSWASVSTNRVTLAPGESREVPFVVRVPSTGALPGQNLGAIVAENAKVDAGQNAGRDRGRFQVKIRNLSVVAVQVNLPGPKVADMAIGGVKEGGSQGGFQAILVNLSSRGNYLLKPSLATRVENASGKVVQSYSGKLDTVVPRTAIDFPIPVRKRALGPGRYTAYITLRFAGKTINAVRRFEISGGQVKQIFGSKAPNEGR